MRPVESDMALVLQPVVPRNRDTARDGFKPCPVSGRYLVRDWGRKGVVGQSASAWRNIETIRNNPTTTTPTTPPTLTSEYVGCEGWPRGSTRPWTSKWSGLRLPLPSCTLNRRLRHHASGPMGPLQMYRCRGQRNRSPRRCRFERADLHWSDSAVHPAHAPRALWEHD
jgi:hypothetical protein